MATHRRKEDRTEPICNWDYFDERRIQWLGESLGALEQYDFLAAVRMGLSIGGPTMGTSPFIKKAVSERHRKLARVIQKLDDKGYLCKKRVEMIYEERRDSIKKEYAFEMCSATKYIVPVKSPADPILEEFSRIGLWISSPQNTTYSMDPIQSRLHGTYLLLLELPEISRGGYAGHVSGYSVMKILAESVLTRSKVRKLRKRISPYELMDTLGAVPVGRRSISTLYSKRLVAGDVCHKDDEGRIRYFSSLLAYPLAIATHSYETPCD